MLTPNMRRFAEQGIVRLQMVDGLSVQVRRMLSGLDRFMQQSTATKMTWSLDHDVQGDTDTGYIRKEGSFRLGDSPEDYKEMFHYRTSLRDGLLARGVSLAGYEDFLADCEVLHRQCCELQYQLFLELDAVMGTSFSSQFKQVDKADQLLRAIYYRGCRDDRAEEIAQSHIDRNTATLALYESRPGLQAELGGQWKDVSSGEDAPLWFAGGKIAETASIPALWHRVVHDPFKNQGVEVDRIAVVHFAHHYHGRYRGSTHR